MGRAACLAFAFFLAAMSGEACAGAWTQPEGGWLAIVSVASVSADRRFERDRRTGPADAFVKTEAQALLEYGLTERVTLRAKTGYEDRRQDGFFGDRYAGAGVHEAGARVRVLRRGALVGSAEASLRVARAHDGSGQALEAEMRALVGAGFEVRGRPAFADGQIGYRRRPDAVTDEVVVDLTLGFRPWDRLLLLAQSFSEVAVRTAADGLPVYDRHRLQGSVVFDITPLWAVQAGGGWTAAGSDVLDERHLFASVWRRF